MTAVKLSAGEEALIASIIEHIYPAPKQALRCRLSPGKSVLPEDLSVRVSWCSVSTLKAATR